MMKEGFMGPPRILFRSAYRNDHFSNAARGNGYHLSRTVRQQGPPARPN